MARCRVVARSGIHQNRGPSIPGAGSKGGDAAHPADERVLRAKYLDWCSAQVADHFLALSPAEIYELAERAARGDASGRPSSLAVDPESSTWRSLVERVTEVLWHQLDLPSFETWLEQYRADPAVIEAELLGLWRERE